MKQDLSSLSKIIANWNGEFMPLTEVRVSVLDRGFLFGDAVYEVVRLYNNKLFRLEDHLERLSDSLQSLDIRHVDIDEVKARLSATVKENGESEALVYLQVTRGEAVRAHAYPENYQPNILIYVTPFHNPFEQQHKTGVSAVTYKDIRWGRNDIKATSLAANCMAAQHAKQNGAMEVVFIDPEGYMTEGSHTSLFGIRGGKLVVAPSSSKVLPGITKRQVLELATQTNIELEEMRLKESEIFELDEFFLAGTPEEVISIVKVNDREIGNGKPGPIVRKLHEAFVACLTAHV